MAFNDFSDRGKPDSMIIRCTLSGEECFSLLQGQTVVSVFNLQKVHIASGFACNENAAHPLLLAAARLNGIVQKIAQHRTQFHIGKRHLIGKIEPHLKFCPLCLRHAVVVFNQRIYNGIFAELRQGSDPMMPQPVPQPVTGRSRSPSAHVQRPCGLWCADGV